MIIAPTEPVGANVLPFMHFALAVLTLSSALAAVGAVVVLSGYDSVTKQRWTKIAEPYPPKLCRDVATHIFDTVESLALSHRHFICSAIIDFRSTINWGVLNVGSYSSGCNL